MKKTKKDLLTGNITKTLIFLAFPTMIAFLLQTAFNIIDTIFVGMISPQAIAAVSMVFPVFFFMFALGGGLGVGTSSAIARYLGAKKNRDAEIVAEHSYLIGIIISILFTIFGFLFSKHIFNLMGATESLMPLILSYSKWIFIGSFPMIITLVSNNILRGEGDMKTPMISMLIAIILNIILDPIFIFGWWIFPQMGIEGAAFATFLSRFFAFIYSTTFVLKGKAGLKLNLKHFKFDLGYIKDILRLGIPSSLERITMSISMVIITRIVSGFGELAIAAFGLAFRAESVIIMPCIAMGIATITLVGQNIGANQIDRAKKIAWKSSFISATFMTLLGLLFFFFPEPIVRIFTKDLTLINMTIGYFKYMGPFFGFIGFHLVLGAAFQGSGRGAPSLILNVLRQFVLQIPLMLYFTRILDMGFVGVWLAFPISTIIASTVAITWFKFAKLENKISH